MEELIKNIKSSIERSGFPLEHYIGLTLKQHGWHIITNRNYIDDIKGIEREIDILAYKIYTDSDENIDYITSLIVSCKKSDKHKWCFLTRDIDKDDCNINWTPFHYCTSDERLKYMSEVFRENIINSYIAHEEINKLYSFEDFVFAYQQMVEPANDKERKQNGNICCVKNEDIYNSISTTIKAISNEKTGRLNAYDYREKQRYYTFHALSVFEGDMFKAHFDANSDIEVKHISNIEYLNRHIVGGIDDFYIVHFINRDVFESRLCLFDSMHEQNAITLPNLLLYFYEDIFNDKNRVNFFWEICALELGQTIQTYITVETSLKIKTEPPLPKLSYSYRQNELTLFINDDFYSKRIIDTLNSDEEITEEVSEILYRHYRYLGQFVFRKLPF